MVRVAILPTSKPLRSQIVKRGKVKQVLNGRILGDLAANYDLVIIGSTASDEFYQYLNNYLPINQRARFRLYGRSFFTAQPHPEDTEDGTDQRSSGWMQILTENRINFEEIRKTMGPDLLPKMEHFKWEHMEEFIMDDRVDVLQEADLRH